jgi:hypothetical protein
VGFKEGEEEYREFLRLSELEECRKTLLYLIVLNKLLEQLVALYPLNIRMKKNNEMTFHQLIFNFWARRSLKLKSGFSGISRDLAKKFFRQLRAGSKKPPYRIPGAEESFVKEFMAYASDFERNDAAILKEALSLLWQEFREEYEWVGADGLDEKYSKFISITIY